MLWMDSRNVRVSGVAVVLRRRLTAVQVRHDRHRQFVPVADRGHPAAAEHGGTGNGTGTGGRVAVLRSTVPVLPATAPLPLSGVIAGGTGAGTAGTAGVPRRHRQWRGRPGGT
jgi:hypothetical protein